MSQSKERLLELNARLAQNLTDKGVEATADETTTALVDKVAEILGGDEFIGIKYSDFDIVNSYYLPQTADARSLDKCMVDKNSKRSTCNSLFAGGSSVVNKDNRCAGLKTVYMPEKMTKLLNTFMNCILLTTIIGDLTNVVDISGTFDGCQSLKELPYFPNLDVFQNNAVRRCTSLTSITFYKVLTLWHTGALSGCTNITEINLADGWNISVYAQHCPNLTQECLHDMIEKYADMTGQISPVMNVASENIDKIDEEHKAMATAKNVTLA